VSFALVAVILAAAGYDLIHKAQRVLAYLMLAVLAVYTAGFLATADLATLFRPGPFLPTLFIAQFFAAAGYQLSSSIYVSDYSRYLPREVGIASSFAWTFCGAMIGGAWMMLVGAVGAAAFTDPDIVVALRRSADAIFSGLGFSEFGLILMISSFGGLITITSLNLYGASLTLLSVIDSLRPIRLGVAPRMAALAVVFAASLSLSLVVDGNVLHGFEAFIGVLLYLFTPVDRDQSRGLLLCPQRPLFDPRDVHGGRALWPLELARSRGLRHRLHRHDPRVQDRAIHRPHCRRAGRSGYLDADRPASGSSGLSVAVPRSRSRRRTGANRSAGQQSGNGAYAMIRRLLALVLLAGAGPASAQPIAFPDHFDTIGTPLQSVQNCAGRTVHFTDTGEAGWQPMLFIGGVGTSARAPELVAFLNTLRRRLEGEDRGRRAQWPWRYRL